jgi:hypothetical protein
MSVSHPSTGVLLQSLKPGSQLAMPQLPAVHLGAPLALVHMLPHEPQFWSSISTFVSHPLLAEPSQSLKPVRHVTPQWPALHVGVACGDWGQTLPHIPQFCASVSRLITHPLPPQAANPGLHAGDPEAAPLEPEATPLEPAVPIPELTPLVPEAVPLEPATLDPDPMPLEPEAMPPEVDSPLEPEGSGLDPVALTPEATPLEPIALEPEDISPADPSNPSMTMLEPPQATSKRERTSPPTTRNGLFTTTVLSTQAEPGTGHQPSASHPLALGT